MTLGVFPAATSTPTGVCSQRFEALFPRAGALGCEVCFSLPLFLPVYLRTNVGPPSLPAATLPRVLSTQLPVSAPPTGLGECFFFNSWLLGFHTVLFSGSSSCFPFLNCCPSFDCVRRHSVSTYASILAGSLILEKYFLLLWGSWVRKGTKWRHNS